MKKFVVVLLALVMVLSFSVVSAKDYKVAMICDSSINDGGWGMACYQAMIDARNDFDNFVNTSRPEILDKSYSNVTAAALVKSEFNKLFNTINSAYESH